jgi:UDP-N-acetylglucosamine 2-epimerase (non-hydrolysing)
MPSGTGAAPILCVVGARPNFMKIAPVIRAMRGATPPLPVRLVHTGQHYDPELNSQFFRALEIPDPDVNLEVGSASHAVQTAEIMRRIEPVLDRERPAAVLVVGDVNSTLACALVAAKKGVPVVHVEAGLRSFDRSMPEEITACSPTRSRSSCSPPRRARETTCCARGLPRRASTSWATS